MVQPHPTSPLPARSLPLSALDLDHSPANTFVNKGASGAEAEAEFRAGLRAATPHLRAFAKSLVGDRDRADDLVQDTLLRAWQYRDRFEPGSNLEAWLFTMLRRLFYSEYRKGRREVEDVDGQYAAKVSTPAEQPGCVALADLRSALMRLPDEQREAVLLVGAAGYSYEEAAVICGIKIGTIKSRVNRARRRLAELLGHEDDGDGGPDGETWRSDWSASPSVPEASREPNAPGSPERPRARGDRASSGQCSTWRSSCTTPIRRTAPSSGAVEVYPGV